MLSDVQQFLSEIASNDPLFAASLFVLLRAACILGGPFVIGGAVDLFGIAIFGAIRAFVLAEIGIMLGASLAFAIGRRFRGHARRWRWLGTQIDYWETRLEQRQQFLAWTLIRLCTNPLFDALSYAAGITNSSFRMFFFSTLLGNIPSVALFFAFSGMILGGEMLWGVVGMLVLLVAGSIVYRRIRSA